MIVIVIPAYNEQNSIGRVVKLAKKYYENVLVVDDGSTDETMMEALEGGATVIPIPVNKGLGAATRLGFERALEMGADIAVKIDADFQHEVEDIEKVINPILEDEADCVFGTRFKGGLKYKMPLYRNLGNKFFSFLVSLLTGLKVTDGQTGLMAFHRRYLEKMNIISDYNETQQLIMDSYGKHMRIMEVPVTFNKRITGKSFISWRYPLKVVPTIFRHFMAYGSIKVFTFISVVLLLLGYPNQAGVAFLFGLLADLISTKK